MPRLDQLTNLRPDPSPSDREDEARRRDMFIAQCEMLLDSETWQFAWETVASMRDRVQAGDQPTEKMWQAVQNIEAGGKRHRNAERRWSRRYEGR